MRRWLPLLAVLAVGCDDRPAPSPTPKTTSKAPTSLAPSWQEAAGLRVLVRYTGGAKPTDAVLLIVALHGLGDRPESFAGLFSGYSQPARLALISAPKPFADGFSWFDYRDDASADELSAGIRAAAVGVARATEVLSKRAPTSKVVVTGFSQGGMLSFALAALRPELYSAAYPLGGTLPRPLWPLRGDAARKLPIVIALHGEDDPRVPIGPARLGVQALRDAGYHAELRGFAGVGHGVSPLMRRELWALLGS
ncbi:MAG: dienelactone hydrolase family protein [Myxococcales bacterium]|nr:dienelactone hydrolase family protein [Myxococcales bacterium]MCB9578701.1 dienelactone hydrolase family protein [Polyangiaceae bacterium]